MLEKYNHLFDLYLGICKGTYNPQKPYDNLDKCVELCGNYREQLMGMVDLIFEMGVISREQADAETQRIIYAFSSISICNAYVEKGALKIFT